MFVRYFQLQGWIRRCLCAWTLSISLGFMVQAQEGSLTNEPFDQASLEHRTALSHDPLLQANLDALLQLYRDAGRVDELIGLYRSHVETYRDDEGAKTVLIQILTRENRPEAGELLTSAVTSHPNNAALNYLLFQFLEEKGDVRALEALSRAIDLEPNGSRSDYWLDELLKLAESDAARQLAKNQLGKRLAVEDLTVLQLLDLAKKMQQHQYWSDSLNPLERASKEKLSTEQEVEASLMMAQARVNTDDAAGAAELLDQLLKKLPSDYWRRREILSVRFSVIASQEERQAAIAAYRNHYVQNPKSEAAAIDYAEMLIANEQQREAIDLLLASAKTLKTSEILEKRTLELLSSGSYPEALEQFLIDRLEQDPSRSGLRFRLVKVRYALDKTAEAEQDFKAVVAGLEPAELSEKILELQRYLRTIDRIDAATQYLERYVRNHPERVDVAQELAEIYVNLDQPDKVTALVDGIDVGTAEREALISLATFLIDQALFSEARSLLKQTFEIDPNAAGTFDIGLLLIQVYANTGEATQANELTNKLREMASTPQRYGQWLETAVYAHRRLESLDSFIASEQARYSLVDEAWPEEKIERFMLLGELGKEWVEIEPMLQIVRRSLERKSLAPELKIRLRTFLVTLLEQDLATAPEAEAALKRLIEEDPGQKADYNIRLAMLYHRINRLDLSQAILTELPYSEVKSVDILRETAALLVEYGYPKEATEALKQVNQLVPEDLDSWERRLTLLASIKQESEFRTLLRALRNGEANFTLRHDTKSTVDKHLQASFWRSIARLIASGDPVRFEEALPLLASVDRENQSFTEAAWTEWTRAIILKTLGREEEADEALARLSPILEKMESDVIAFPDGLYLARENAEELIRQTTPLHSSDPKTNAVTFFAEAELGWGFELEMKRSIEQFSMSQNEVLIVDDQAFLYSIDRATGKLLWKKPLRPRAGQGSSQQPDFFLRHTYFSVPTEAPVVALPSLVVSRDRLFLYQGDSIYAIDTKTGELHWKAQIQTDSVFDRGGMVEPFLAANEKTLVSFQPDSGSLAGFDIETGKQEWRAQFKPAGSVGKLTSLNTGLALDGNRVFAYGWQAAIFDANSGKAYWGFDSATTTTFPTILTAPDDSDPSLPQAFDPLTMERNTQLIDFTGPQLALNTLSALRERDLAMVSPAIFWTQGRLAHGMQAYAELDEGFLWLMEGESVRRLSIRLPVASRQLPGKGTFLGAVKSHAWLLDQATLHHLDFNGLRVTQIDLGDMGDQLRATLSGYQLIVRGQASVRVINALTGKVIGNFRYASELTDYLRTIAIEPDAETPIEYRWRGISTSASYRHARFCLPVRDLFSEDTYITQFGGRTLVCLKRASAPTRDQNE